MDHSEKLATFGTQDDEKQHKKHNIMCVRHHNKVNKYK
jgi:hypothetical protein